MDGFTPATAANSGPMALSFNSQPDATTWLPPNAGERLRQLRQHSHDLHSLCVPFEERLAASNAKVEAEQRLKRLQAHSSMGGFGLKDDDQRVVHARKQVEKLTDDLDRLTKLDATRSAAWTAASQTQSAVEAYLKDGRPPGTVLEDFDATTPTLNKGETVLDAVARHRRRARELKADLHRIRSSPFPSSHAKAQMRAQIETLAQRGAPSVSHLVEHDRPVEWPTQMLRSTVINTEVPALAFAEGVPDTLALFAWLHRDALIKRLDVEIDSEADDKSALTHEARQKAEVVVLGDLLAVERDEAALVWRALSERLPVEHRNDCSPLAILQCALVTAPAVSASPGSSRGHSFDLRR